MIPALLLQRISSELTQLRKSERKVADYVLQHLEEVIHLRITDLAKMAEVSEPTVIRFCRAVGCSGFQDFKMTLAQDLASSPNSGQFALTETDTASDYCKKVLESTADTLLQLSGDLDIAAITDALNIISAANRVEFFGFGASSFVAADAHQKFYRLQVSTAAHSDLIFQNMSANTMQAGDVVVAISQTGRTSALLESIALVQQSGAKVIGIGPGNSPVIEAVDIPIEVNVQESVDLYTPLSSRIAHLLVIDILVVGVAQRRGPELKEHLFKLKQGFKTMQV